MKKPKTATPSRKEIELVLQKAVVAALQTFDEAALDGPTGLCRVGRSLFGIALEIFLSGDAPEEVILVQLDRTLVSKLGRKRKKKAVVTTPGTLGSVVMKGAKA